MRHFLPFVVIILLSGLITCKVQDEQLSPDLLHFDATGDTMALDLAAQVLETNGGQQAWSESRYVAWTFLDAVVWYGINGGNRYASTIPTEVWI